MTGEGGAALGGQPLRSAIAPSARRDDLGASLVEYALLIALIALAAFLSLQIFGSARNNSLSRSGSAIAGAIVVVVNLTR